MGNPRVGRRCLLGRKQLAVMQARVVGWDMDQKIATLPQSSGLMGRSLSTTSNVPCAGPARHCHQGIGGRFAGEANNGLLFPPSGGVLADFKGENAMLGNVIHWFDSTVFSRPDALKASRINK